MKRIIAFFIPATIFAAELSNSNPPSALMNPISPPHAIKTVTPISNDGEAAAAETPDESVATVSRPRLALNFGYVFSKWNKISSQVRNGSTLFGVSIVREFVKGFEGGLTANMIVGSDNSSGAGSINASYLSFDGRYFVGERNFRPFFGLSMAFGNYRVWSVAAESDSQITFTKSASGAFLGLVPALGVRVVLSPHSAVDIYGAYQGFFDNPVSKAGGWTVGASLNFGR